MKTQTTETNFLKRRGSNAFFFLLSGLLLIFISCDSGSDDAPAVETPSAGVADVTLTAGGQQFKINGPCGWATAMGNNYIGANHAENNLRTLAAFFNITSLPTVTTTYQLVENTNDTAPNHITMSISQIAGSTLTGWKSKNASGSLTMVVNGNTITVNLAGITLYPETNHGFYNNGNTGAFSNNGALTGTLTFYRN